MGVSLKNFYEGEVKLWKEMVTNKQKEFEEKNTGVFKPNTFVYALAMVLLGKEESKEEMKDGGATAVIAKMQECLTSIT